MVTYNEKNSSNKSFRVASIEQDLAAMSKETGTASFSYDDIHNSKVDNTFHYDSNKVIDDVSKAKNISNLEAEKQLLQCGALRPLPNGEYFVDVGYTTRNGGGRNMNGEVFFTFSKDDVINRYHEMAHSYQIQEKLFNDDKLDKMYDLSQKGLQPEDNPDTKLADREVYQRYLRESHSEIFALTTLMLREKNMLGFAKQALYAQSYGELRNAGGLIAGTISPELGECSKLYACKPIMHAAINEVANIRKSGKRADYFNPNGTINGKKVSDLCEKIVLDNAYSPRTYKAFLDNNFNDTHTSDERDWKKGSMLAVAKMLPAHAFISLHNSGKKFKKAINKIKHNSLRKKELAQLKAMSMHRTKNSSPQAQAINDYAYIQAKMLLIGANSKYANADDVLLNMVDSMHKDKLADDELKSMSINLKVQKNYKDFVEINSVIQQNKNNPYFQEMMDNPSCVADLKHHLIKENKQDTKTQSLSGKEKLATMTKNEQNTFVSNLRMGVNTLLDKDNNSPSVKQSQPRTCIQQADIMRAQFTKNISR